MTDEKKGVRGLLIVWQWFEYDRTLEQAEEAYNTMGKEEQECMVRFYDLCMEFQRARHKRYHFNMWQPRALAFARSLKGRERTPVEQRIADEAKELDDKWHYFMAFGVQPETQTYIDGTIRKLEELDPESDEYWQNQAIAEIRLHFSAEETLCSKELRDVYDWARQRRYRKELKKMEQEVTR